MKRVWAVCLGSLAAIIFVSGCNDYGNTFQNNTGAVITTLSPSTVAAGSPDFTLTVQGGGFVTKTVVQWNGKTIASTVVTDSSGNILYMTATVPAALVAQPGSAIVNTLNPHSGSTDNGLSNSVAFIINPPPNPVPVVSSISPTITAPGSASLTLMINGSNFLPTSDPTGGSLVYWNFGPSQYTFTPDSITSSLIQVTVDSSYLQTEGCAIVSVYNKPSPDQQGTTVSNPPGGGGGTSANAPTFTISTNPDFCTPSAQAGRARRTLAAKAHALGIPAALFPSILDPRARNATFLPR
ncbi:MAG TPA: hypothetical protein VLX32_10770 [Candidatus Acidoferrum sp.]|nr:hypothetical protein [Candidatus Acidoferrum sp.]